MLIFFFFVTHDLSDLGCRQFLCAVQLFLTTTNTLVAEVQAKLRSLSKSSSSSIVFLKDFLKLHFPMKCGKAKLQSYK